MRLVFTVLMILTVSLTTIAQFKEGYYLSSGDTVKGYIKLFKNLDKAVFKRSLDSKEIEHLNPKFIDEIVISNSEKIVSHRIENLNRSDPFYLKVIIQGSTNFYQSVLRNTEYFFIQNRENQIVLLDKEKFRNQLSIYFYDCENVHQDILSPKKSIDYRVRDLHDIVFAYNICQNQNAEVNSSYIGEERVFFKIGLELSYLNQSFSVTGPTLIGGRLDYPDNTSIGFGVLGEVSIKNFAIETGLQFNPREASLQSVRSMTLMLNQLSIPILIRYYFPTGSFQPFINVGIQTGIPLNNSFSNLDLGFEEPEFAFSLGGGIKKDVAKRGEVSLSLQYINGSLPFTTFLASGRVLSEMYKVSLGYKYYLSKK